LSLPEFYTGYMKRLARYGFVVAGYRGCPLSIPLPWTQCQGGQRSFLEVLSVISFFQLNSGADVRRAPVDIEQPVTAVGHSTGARAVLMAAAVKDDPQYLQGTNIKVSPRERDAANKIAAVVGIFGDPMDNPTFNPDVRRWEEGAIDKTPAMFVTSTADFLVPKLASWNALTAVKSPAKVFIDFRGTILWQGHLSPWLSKISARWSGTFARALGLDDQSALETVYGNGTRSFQKVIHFAKMGQRNTGEGKWGMVLCAPNGTEDWPVEAAAHFCAPRK